MPEVKINIKKEKFLPIYQPLILDPEHYDIDFLYGGRDSGKSRHIAMQLIVECLRKDVFRCLMVRKVLNTVRDSQYSLIKSITEEWKIDHLFHFNSSRLEITCKINGNGFFGRGLDDVARIKSFNNPTCCWIEEGNQIEATDFVVLLTSLRSNAVRVKTWFSFNPECEVSYTEFWLWQDWFSHTTDLSFRWVKTIDTPKGPVEFKIRATHGTYQNNPYCSDERMALYESYRTSKNNAYWYQTYTLGLWGYRRPGGEFYKCFEEDVHTADISWRGDTYHFVLDNNVNPYVSVQIWNIDAQGQALLQVGEIPCEHPDNTAVKAARRVIKFLRLKDYAGPVYIYGDPSANAKSTTDDEGRSFFDKFIGEVKNAGYQVVNRVGKSAPSVAMSGSFVNELFENQYGGWKILIDKSCRKSIEDYNMTVEDIDGGILKKRVTNKDTKVSYEKYGHMVDCSRYFVTTTLASLYTQYMQRLKGLPRSGGVASAPRQSNITP